MTETLNGHDQFGIEGDWEGGLGDERVDREYVLELWRLLLTDKDSSVAKLLGECEMEALVVETQNAGRNWKGTGLDFVIVSRVGERRNRMWTPLSVREGSEFEVVGMPDNCIGGVVLPDGEEWDREYGGEWFGGSPGEEVEQNVWSVGLPRLEELVEGYGLELPEKPKIVEFDEQEWAEIATEKERQRTEKEKDAVYQKKLLGLLFTSNESILARSLRSVKVRPVVVVEHSNGWGSTGLDVVFEDAKPGLFRLVENIAGLVPDGAVGVKIVKKGQASVERYVPRDMYVNKVRDKKSGRNVEPVVLEWTLEDLEEMVKGCLLSDLRDKIWDEVYGDNVVEADQEVAENGNGMAKQMRLPDFDQRVWERQTSGVGERKNGTDRQDLEFDPDQGGFGMKNPDDESLVEEVTEVSEKEEGAGYREELIEWLIDEGVRLADGESWDNISTEELEREKAVILMDYEEEGAMAEEEVGNEAFLEEQVEEATEVERWDLKDPDEVVEEYRQLLIDNLVEYEVDLDVARLDLVTLEELMVEVGWERTGELMKKVVETLGIDVDLSGYERAMIETVSPRAEPVDMGENLERFLEGMFETEFVSQMMEQFGASLEVAPEGYGDFHGLFAYEDDPETIIGVPLLGMENVVGFVMLDPNMQFDELVELDERMREVLRERNIHSANIAFIFPDDVEHWIRFYEDLDESDLFEESGGKAEELSGLTRASVRYASKVFNDFLDRFDIDEDGWVGDVGLLSVGVERFQVLANPDNADELWLDAAFFDKEGNHKLVEMNHVRQCLVDESGELWLDGEVLYERIETKPMWVPGMLVLREDRFESKRDFYRRAVDVKRKMGKWMARHYPEIGEDEWTIAVVTGGQFKVWDKLGMWENLDELSRVEGFPVEEVIRFLFLGEHGGKRGKLAQLGFPLPDLDGINGLGSAVDIPFKVPDQSGIDRVVPISEPMISFDFKQFERNESCADKLRHGKLPMSVLTGLGEVVGIKFIPDDLPEHEMKKLLVDAQDALRPYSRVDKPNVLLLTPSLFKAWLSNGSPFADTAQVAEFARREPVRAAVEYRLVNIPGGVGYYYVNFSREGGAHFDALAVVAGSKPYYFPTNVGDDFGIEVLGKSTGDFIEDLDAKRFSAVPGLVGVDRLAHALVRKESRVSVMANNDPSVEFVRLSWFLADLSGRLTEEHISDVGRSLHEKVLRLGKKDWEKWDKPDEAEVEKMIVSEGHADHVGQMDKINEKADLVMSRDVRILLEVSDALASSHLGKRLPVTHLSSGKGKFDETARGYEVVTSPDDVVDLGMGINVRFFEVDHTTVAAMRLFTLPSGLKVLNTGDLMEGEKTDAAIRALADEDVDVIITEATRTSDFDPYDDKNESHVVESLLKVEKLNENRLIVAAAPEGHIDRLASILEMAEQTGRKVAMTPKHAAFLNGLSVMNFSRDLLSEYADTVYWFGEAKGSHLRALQRLSESGDSLMRPVDMIEDPEKWIVVPTPYEKLSKVMEQVPRGDYSVNGKRKDGGFAYVVATFRDIRKFPGSMMNNNRNWAMNNGGLVYANYGKGRQDNGGMIFHVPGHMNKKARERMIMDVLGNKWVGKVVLLAYGGSGDLGEYGKDWAEELDKRASSMVSFEDGLKRGVGLDRPDELSILAVPSLHDQAIPYNVDDDDPIGVNGFKYRLEGA